MKKILGILLLALVMPMVSASVTVVDDKPQPFSLRGDALVYGWIDTQIGVWSNGDTGQGTMTLEIPKSMQCTYKLEQKSRIGNFMSYDVKSVCRYLESRKVERNEGYTMYARYDGNSFCFNWICIPVENKR